ncbi:MAG TPA: MAC/perforin domain-containing protein [Thermoanaerobaculia bacterium]|nr:MAC/perforin domain-containing protein [Thermoanaerobaculia bacterium]
MTNKINNTPQPPTGLYQGYDSFQGQVRDAAVSGTTNTVDAVSSNLVSICTDIESVMQAINASASLSGGFLDVSVDAKASWAQSLSLTSTSVAVIVHSVVMTGQTQADVYALSSSVTPPTSSNVQDFFNAYGDSFVNQVALGGEYYAAFVFNSTTASQQTEITGSLAGSGGGISASLSVAITNAASKSQTNLTMSQQMLGVSNPSYPPDDPTAIVNFAVGFGGTSQSIDAPTLLCYATTGYEHVPDVSGFSPIETNRNLLGTATAAPFVDAFTTLTTMSSQCALIKQMYSAYQYTGDSSFLTNALQVTNDLAALNTLIADIEANVTGTFTAPTFPSLGLGVPLVTYSLNESFPVLPLASGSFYDLSPTQIANGVMPAAITIFSGTSGPGTSLGIQVTYSDGTYSSQGYTGGTPQGTLTLSNGDSIASVTIMSNGAWAEDAQITTARGQSIGSVVSQPMNYAFDVPPIIGFYGGLLAAPVYPSTIMLGAIAITMMPALWVHPIPPSAGKRTAQRRPRHHGHAQAQA